MNATPSGRTATTAWQPFTFGGVAAFAHAATVRLLVVSLLVAALVGWTVERVIRLAWFPAVELAVRHLPPVGEIRGGALRWPTNAVTTLADTRFLTIVVNPNVAPLPGNAADVQLEFTASELCLHSLFGYWAWPYPRDQVLALDRTTVEPVWAAWRPTVRLGVLGGTIGGLLLVWSLVALIAAPFLRAYVWVLHRAASMGGCWRLAMAALLPGGLLVAAALFFYATHAFVLSDVVIAFALAHLLDLVLMLGAPWCLPREQPTKTFATPAPDAEGEAGTNPAPEERSPVPPAAPKRLPFAPIFSDGPRYQRTTNPFAAGRPAAPLNPPPVPPAPPTAAPEPTPEPPMSVSTTPVASPTPEPASPAPAPSAAPPPEAMPVASAAPAAPPPPPDEDEPVFNPS